MDELNHCPQCPRHCPEDALNCGRGRAFFGQEDGASEQEHGHGGRDNESHGSRDGNSGHHGKPDKSTVEGLLRLCGHTLHHGGVNGDLCASLSENEQEQLKALLTKLVEGWN